MDQNTPDTATLFDGQHGHPALGDQDGGSVAGGALPMTMASYWVIPAMLRCNQAGRRDGPEVSGGQTATIPLLCPTG